MTLHLTASLSVVFAVFAVSVIGLTTAQENAEYESTTEGFSNDTFSDSDGEDLDLPETTTPGWGSTEMTPEPGTSTFTVGEVVILITPIDDNMMLVIASQVTCILPGRIPPCARFSS